jgi:predicted amidophosphoribosyltransferase
MIDVSEAMSEQGPQLSQRLSSGTAILYPEATECGECRQPLEEWEAGVCEGCGLKNDEEN